MLRALSPSYASVFCIQHGLTAFVALGAVVLAVTGAEALYADMGHFGAQADPRGLAVFVLPCLVLNYFGQGALMLRDPEALREPVLPAGAALAAPADGDPGHRRHRDRQPGADLRRLFRWRGNACSSASCRA